MRSTAATVPLRRAKSPGADVIELGVPFSDPMADGSAIEAASVVAIKNGPAAVEEVADRGGVQRKKTKTEKHRNDNSKKQQLQFV